MHLKTLLKKIGYEYIYVLLDELESIETLHVLKKQKILNSIRRIIDLNPVGLSLIMACTPESWNSIISDYHAFSERIFRHVTLRPLDNQMLKQLIVDYIRIKRIDNNENLDDLYPFDQESLKSILLVGQGNLRKVIMICNRSVDKGIECGSDKLSKENLTQILPELFDTTFLGELL